MPLVSEQAILPRFNPRQKGQVIPPELRILAAPGALTIYDNTDEQPLQEIFLQNNANTAVKVCINNDASANAFHFVLKAASGTDTGDGGERSIDMQLGVSKVSIYTASTARISVTKVTNGNALGRF